MKKKKRMWIRTIILMVLFGAVIYTLYFNLFVKDKNQMVQVGEEAPNFILSTLNGDKVELSDHRGKAILINFWGSWCGPCKKEMPAIQEAYNQYKNQNFEVFTINIEESNFIVKNFFKNNNLSLPVLMDKDGQVNNAYGVFTIPSSFFLNPNGTVNRMYEGEMTKDNLDQWINEILPK